MELAARAGAVGLDPWRVLRPGARAEVVATRALVEGMEREQAALAAAQANVIADRVVGGIADLLVILGLLERKEQPRADR